MDRSELGLIYEHLVCSFVSDLPFSNLNKVENEIKGVKKHVLDGSFSRADHTQLVLKSSLSLLLLLLLFSFSFLLHLLVGNNDIPVLCKD